MSSIPCPKDDNVVVEDTAAQNEQGESEHQPPKQYNVDQTEKEQGTSGSKIEETNKATGPSVEENQSVENFIENSTASGSENEENKNVPTSSKLIIDEVDSRRPDSHLSGSGNTKPSTRRIHLKRRSSRISIPTVGGVETVAEEVDSAPPRASKRRVQKKKIVALFLDSDFPRRK